MIGQFQAMPTDVQRLQAAGIPNVLVQAMFEDANLRTLVVQGDGMDALLNEGDIVIYTPQPQVGNGEVALLNLRGKLTLRRIHYDHNDVLRKSITLQPLDLRIPASVADLDALNIKGRMVAVIRKVNV
jgi:SOS-response transcriptional repressor LexA